MIVCRDQRFFSLIHFHICLQARDSDEIGLDEVKDVDRTSDSDRDASDLHLLAHDTSPR